MKNVILLGRKAVNISNLETGINLQNINLYGGTNLEDLKNIFAHNEKIDIVIMGAGIDLNKRLELIAYIFENSKNTTVHMKDWNSGPTGMLPFVNAILEGLVY